MKDSGERQSFDTGAVRDTQEGKGRFDLLPPIALRRVAKVFEKGAKKYDARNWEKGIPISRFMDSAFRHLSDYMEGKRDEDHLGQAAFNVLAAIHTEEMVERGHLPASLANTPNYLREDQHKGPLSSGAAAIERCEKCIRRFGTPDQCVGPPPHGDCTYFPSSLANYYEWVDSFGYKWPTKTLCDEWYKTHKMPPQGEPQCSVVDPKQDAAMDPRV